MTHIYLYRSDEPIPFPDSDHGRLLQGYTQLFRQAGVDAAIDNADTELGFIQINDVMLPYTVGCARRGLSYVCSPQSHYIDYAMEELDHVSSRLSRWAGKLLLPLVGSICRFGELDRVVMVNNWLLSTNLYPELTLDHLLSIRDELRLRYPDHAILFRSLDSCFHSQKLDQLAQQGAMLVMSRRVHILNRDHQSVWRKNNIKNDQRLQRKTSLKRVGHDDLNADDFHRILELYRLLYLDKYSTFNPQFSIQLLTQLWQERTWIFEGWRNRHGELDAICATFSVEGIRCAPLIGYDTRKPQREGLYRLAYLDMLEAGRQRDEHIHCSAGVAVYKQNRGAHSFFEYNAVFADHLPRRRRFPWRLLRWILDQHIAPLMLQQNL